MLSCAGTGNFGDDIIYEGIKRMAHGVFKDVEFKQFFRITAQSVYDINQCDVLIIGGGELLSASDILDQIVTHAVKIPYAFLSVGVGEDIDIASRVSVMDPLFWSVRSKEGAQILKNAGLIDVWVVDDPIFQCPVMPRDKNGRIALCLKNVGHEFEFCRTWLS